MIIAFTSTAEALLAGRKIRTRRFWTPKHVARVHAEMLMDAWDKSPRQYGQKIASIRITTDPWLQYTYEIHPDDWEKEGFAYMTERGLLLFGKAPVVLWDAWRSATDLQPYVVDFELVNHA